MKEEQRIYAAGMKTAYLATLVSLQDLTTAVTTGQAPLDIKLLIAVDYLHKVHLAYSSFRDVVCALQPLEELHDLIQQEKELFAKQRIDYPFDERNDEMIAAFMHSDAQRAAMEDAEADKQAEEMDWMHVLGKDI